MVIPPTLFRPSRYWLLIAPLLAVVAVIYIWPVLNILWPSFTEPSPGLQNYEQLVTNPLLLRIVWTTVRICLITTVVSVTAGYLVAYLMTHLAGREKSWMLSFVLVSFWVSVLVWAFAWLTLLGHKGPLNALCQDSDRQLDMLSCHGMTPSNPAAAAKIPEKLRRYAVTAPENIGRVLFNDPVWWADNIGDTLNEYLGRIS